MRGLLIRLTIQLLGFRWARRIWGRAAWMEAWN